MALAVVGGIVLVAVYVVFVRTSAGQTWDDESLIGRVGGSRSTARMSQRLLSMIDGLTIVAFAVVIVVVGIIRRRRRLALVAAISAGAAIASAELLKLLLPRPELADSEVSALAGKAFDTYPSGHATIATAFVLALVLVSRNTTRPAVALFGVLWSSVIASGAVAAGWHRPSDVLGGIALACFWLALGAWFLARRSATYSAPGRMSRAMPLAAGFLIVILLAGLSSSRLDGDPGLVPSNVSALIFPASQILIDLFAVAVVAAFAVILRDVSFGSEAPSDDRATAVSARVAAPEGGR